MIDDRRPMVLVVLDGLGDRGSEVLGGATPCEAARTPTLDALAGRGASGLHVPFGPGRATSSERAHWALFGFDDLPFPGRAVIEALGVGTPIDPGVPMFHLALRAGMERDGALWLGARARRSDDENLAEALFDALAGRTVDGVQFELLPLRTGECVLAARGAATHQVSDTDSLFDHLHPWMRPRALANAAYPEAAAAFAATLETWLRDSRRILSGHPANSARIADGLPALDTAVTKWASCLDPDLPSFAERVGLSGAAVTDTALYRGLARLLDMASIDIVYDSDDPGGDMASRIASARELLGKSAFVHVHIKATDEAGHTKDPVFKKSVIEAVDTGLVDLLELADSAVVTVTGDHATPSTGQLLHSGDPTPIVVAGPGIRPDQVNGFGELPAAGGSLGTLAARDVLPLMAGFANRPSFLGYHPGPRATVALPDAPEPMPLD